MEQRPAFIVYDGLPVSAGGAHRIRQPRPELVWDQVARFLDVCAEPVEPLKVNLELYSRAPTPDALSAAAEQASALHGPGSRRTVASGTRDRSELFATSWLLEPAAIPGTLVWMGALPTIPAVNNIPAVVLSVRTIFRVRDPLSGEVLPYQGEEHYKPVGSIQGVVPIGLSSLFLRLSSQGSTCGLVMCLPFEEATDDLRACVGRLRERLPFKLSSKHWSRWSLNKKRTAYYARKIDVLA